ncbi:efflux RND transporter permease subunit [Chitinophaga sp. GbtcB8]|uniref:efflux RND transporter permease subunit n=1 Tax=Chitinophaga sp. GbtcB8 TaxID=2824753 RepID=UPI001C30A208|nr:efflux RND transporter permease subunit [Chitinophaga sp. GbtcB8]
MNLIKLALQKPIAVIVIVIGLLFFGISSLRDIKIDIFPDLNLPSIYVSQPYGGMSPQQMEGFISTNYQNLFLYVTGIKAIEIILPWILRELLTVLTLQKNNFKIITNKTMHLMSCFRYYGHNTTIS